MQAPPIRISPDDFARLHFLHLTQHPPDSVLFPFLHGIEGNNQAQNTFFISPYSAASPPRPPQFRGLVWVVAEEDLEPEQKLSLYSDRDDDEDEDIFDDEDEELDDMHQSPMDVDNVLVHEESHMHPVAHRDPSQFKELSKVSHTFVRRASDVSDGSDTNPNSPLAYQPPATPPPPSPTSRLHRPPILTSSFRPSELIQQTPSGDWQFIPLLVPEGISLRNFGVQVPIYATLSDIVIYSPKGVTPAALELARKFKAAVDHKRSERLAKYSASTEDEPWLNYRVMVLDADEGLMRQKLPHMMVSMLPADAAHTRWQDGDTQSQMRKHNGIDLREAPNSIDFARREKDEMRELTKASEIISLVPPDVQTADPNSDPRVGQLYLGNLEDVPVVPELPISPLPVSFPPPEHADSPFNSMNTNPNSYDICVECHDLAPFPSVSQLKMAEEHLATMERKWMEYCSSVGLSTDTPRPPPHANAILHLPFPSSPPSTAGTMALLVPLLRFFEKWLQPIEQPVSSIPEQINGSGTSSRRWSTVSNLFPSLSNTSIPSRPAVNPYANAHPPSSLFRARSQTVPAPSLSQSPPRTRPLKILLYSADGYTESSVPALCLLMTVRSLKLPEAYLELQVEKQRSFFVYGGDISLLKRVEARVCKSQETNHTMTNGNGNHTDNGASPADTVPPPPSSHSQARPIGRPPAKSVSFTKPIDAVPMASSYPASPIVQPPESMPTPAKGRPRANTSPWLPSFRDHLSWFNDSRFDGSFPSRVLPFLYLGNLNHASNVYMLHALGITHVVSVGECALVPPPQLHGQCPPRGEGRSHVQLIQGKEGSLWIEEREGRIKVLDIKGVCDDGIDTLEPQLEPICDWIDKAREEGGKVLVHCRVGVSRSATVTIAYVMKYLQIPLSDAYLIVRSRRLSVLIQPNMRLMYNLLGWEIRLAKERANNDEERLKYELAGALTWPYLAKEVHALNEKYLH